MAQQADRSVLVIGVLPNPVGPDLRELSRYGIRQVVKQGYSGWEILASNGA